MGQFAVFKNNKVLETLFSAMIITLLEKYQGEISHETFPS